MPWLHDDILPADPIIPRNVWIAERPKAGCDYRILPNWLRSGQQMGQGGPGGAIVDTAFSFVID